MSDFDSPAVTVRSDAELTIEVSAPVVEASAAATGFDPETTSDAALISDATLISRFLAREEAAFQLLVERHGAMVYAVALRTVREHHAAEDVYQATFLVFARDAARIRKVASCSAWLHGVAVRIAKKALLRRQRQPVPLDQSEVVASVQPTLDEIAKTFDQQILDEELSRLPASYREPLVLHFLEGQTYEETAHSLGTSVGAIEGRLKRGKRELRLRLMRRGVGLGMVLVAINWSQSLATAAQQTALVQSTVTGGMSMISGTPFAAPITAEAIHLTREIAMWTTVKSVALALTAMLVCVGIGAVGARAQAPVGTAAGSAPIQSTVAEQGTKQRTIQGSDQVDMFGNLELAQGESLPPSNLGRAYPGGSSGLPSDAFDQAGSGAAGAGAGAAGSDGTGLSMSSGYPRVDKVTVYTPGMNNANTLRIQAALEESVSLEFSANPLSDVVSFLSETFSIPIRFDEASLTDEGIGPEAEVNIVIQDVSLRSALNILLENIDNAELDYVIQNEVLVITSRSKADEMLETRVYDVRALEINDPQDLQVIIERGTSGLWSDNGDGEGTQSYTKGAFFIRQTQRVHREIEALLELMAQHIQTADGDLPEWSTPAPGYPGMSGGYGPGMGSGSMIGGGGMMGGGGGQQPTAPSVIKGRRNAQGNQPGGDGSN